jgi:hypothetical protein
VNEEDPRLTEEERSPRTSKKYNISPDVLLLTDTEERKKNFLLLFFSLFA